MRGGGFNTIVLVISIFLGAYLLNSSFNWVKIPEQFASADPLIDAIAGGVLIFLGVVYSLSRRHYGYGRGYPY